MNPLISEPGMTDPHLKFFDGKFWLYTGHDAGPESTTWVMPDWRIYSSTDLRDWKLEGTIYQDQNYMGGGHICAAGDAVYRNGYYYWYFTKAGKGENNVGVMVATQPQGPFHDPLGKPLLPEGISPTKEHDPTVFVDDDEVKTPYLIFGVGHIVGYHIARLNEDMISLAESPRLVEVHGAFHKNDKNFLHKRNGIYYLTCGTDVAVSDNVYGPYTHQGNVGDRWWLDHYAHGSFLEHNGQWFHVWTRYFNRDVNKMRECLMTYTHYTDDGRMVDDVGYLDAHYHTGVGAYDASWAKIEAEWYMAISGAEKKECSEGGFEVQSRRSGDFLYYPNMQNMPENAKISFRVSSSSEVMIEIREDGLSGNVLGVCRVPNTGGLENYETISQSLTNTAGVKDICLVFKSTGDDGVNLNWFALERK
jgi:arabinoxylan arabinofuranohydrolase